MPLNDRHQVHNRKVDAKLHTLDSQISNLKNQVKQLEKELAEKSIHAEELERDMETLRDRIILLKEIIHSLYDIGKEAKITLPHLPEDLLEDDTDYLD